MKNLTLSGLVAIDDKGEEYLIKFPEPNTGINYTVSGTGEIVDIPTPSEVRFEAEKAKNEYSGVEMVLLKHKKNEK